MRNNIQIEIPEGDLRKMILNEDDNRTMIVGGGDEPIQAFQNHIYFCTDVSPISIMKLNGLLVRMAKDHLADAAQKGKTPEIINLHISSYGGCAHSGFLAYDLINKIKERVPIYTYIEGIGASAATFLSIAGTKRYITPSSTMVIHEIRSWMFGTATELSEEYKNVMKLQDKIEKIYTQHSNFEINELREFLKRDTLMLSSDALKRGLVDEIDTVYF